MIKRDIIPGAAIGLLVGVVVILLCSGCAFNRTHTGPVTTVSEFFAPDGHMTNRVTTTAGKKNFTSSMWAQRTALKGLTAHKTGRSSDFSIAEADNETQAEVTNGAFEAIARGAVQGVIGKPPVQKP